MKDKLILIPDEVPNDSEFKKNIELLKSIRDGKTDIFAITNQGLVIVDIDIEENKIK